MVRVGVLGAGGHSTHSHGPALERCRDERPDEIDLRAVCDLERARARRYARQFGFTEAYADAERMLEDASLDALVAVTPVDATREVAADLFTRDVAVLVEKPPGCTVDEARELRAIAASHDADHAVSFNRRFSPAVARAREWLTTAVPDRPPTVALARLLRTERFEEDFVTGTGIHAVDTVCSFLGHPTHVVSRRWQSRPARTEPGDCCTAQATFANATAQFEIVPDAGTYAETYDLIGPGYAVKIDVTDPAFAVYRDGEEVATWRIPADAPSYVRDGTYAETRAFLEAVQRGKGFTPTLADTVASVHLAAAMDAGGSHELE